MGKVVNQEKISLIIPVYNVEAYLRKCLDSVLEQNYQNLEIILVNDGSTDKSGDICYEYAAKDSRIHVIEQENQGLSAARNTGLDIMTGDYVYFLDSDDWIFENAISRLYEVLKDKGVDIAIGHYCGFTDEDSNFHFYDKEPAEEAFTRDEMIAEYPKRRRRNGIFLCAWGKLYKRELFDYIRYPKGRLAEDAFTTYKLYLESEKIHYVNEPLYCYRMRQGSISLTWNEKWFKDLIRGQEEQIVILGQLGYDLTEYYAYYHFLLEYCRDNAKVVGLEETSIYKEIINKLAILDQVKMVEDKKERQFPIVLAADNGYLRQIETTLKSICYHQPHAKVYILNQDIAPEWFENTRKRMARFGAELVDIKLFEVGFQHWSNVHEHINYMAYARYFIPQLVPEDKVLYLDCDMVITHDLSQLYDIDLGDYYFAAAIELLGVYRSLPTSSFNSGMLLINNRKWRKENLIETLVEITQREQDYLINGDQEVLNRVVGDHYYQLSEDYNFPVGLDHSANAYGYHKAFEYSLQPLPKIVHYIGYDKPWNTFSSHRLRDLWWFYNDLEWGEIAQKWEKERGYEERLSLVVPTKHFFTLTNTQYLEQIEYLVTAMPDCLFHIGAYTRMGEVLLRLSQYPNVKLYPAIIDVTIDRLLRECDAYLNITHGSDFEQAMLERLDSSKPIFSFTNTSHLDSPQEHRFEPDKVDEMVEAIRKELGCQN